VLNRLRSGSAADLREDRFALGAVGVRHAHFDELVAFQAAVDFREDGGGQSGSADQYDRIEWVRSRLQFAPPTGR